MDGVTARPRGAKGATKKELIKTKVKKVVVTETLAVSVVDAPEDHYFWLHQGGALRNLRDLAEALESMTDEQLVFHTKREGNDFANWIREIFHEESLADRLERTRTRTGALKVIREAIGE